MNDLKGKVAIVTGASKGIGAAIARQFAKAGAAVTEGLAATGIEGETARNIGAADGPAGTA